MIVPTMLPVNSPLLSFLPLESVSAFLSAIVAMIRKTAQRWR